MRFPSDESPRKNTMERTGGRRLRASLDQVDDQLGVTDVRFDALDQFRRHLANAVFLGVLTRFLKYFLYCLTPYDVLTATRWVYLSAFQHLCHGLPSLISWDLLLCLL
jgi:hypothetical protein